MKRLLGAVLAAGVASASMAAAQTPVAAGRRAIRPDGVPADRPYSPGVLVGKTLYIAGQLGLPGEGATRADMTAQTRQAMDGLGAVLKAAGLGYEHLVKCHVYLANMEDYAAMNGAYGSYFKDRVPARTTIQAVALPGGAGVEIGCIGYADLGAISVVRPPQGSLPAPLGPYSPAVWAGDTLYVSGMGGQDPLTKSVGEAVEAQVTQTVTNITTTLKAAGLSLENVAWTQGYVTRLEEAAGLSATLEKAVAKASPPAGLVAVPRLPGPIRAELSFVATRPSAGGNNFGVVWPEASVRAARRGNTIYVSAFAIPGGGDVGAEAREVFTRLGALLKQGDSSLADVTQVTVYLTDVADLPTVNDVFRAMFPADPPARVTIQVQPQGKERIRIAAIAAKP
ncbi:MAG TPA: RidA family protein [Luteitalea sp.]|nr:RidA family protein [Luteitalea sp.]